MTPVYSSVGLALINVLGGLIFGYQMGSITMALLSLTHLSELQQGGMSMILLAGSALGSLSGGVVCDRWGRVRAVQLLSLLSGLGCIAQASMPGYYAILPFRFLTGLGVGLSCVACPLYVAELAPPRRRGVLSTLFQLAITMGMTISYAVGYLFQLTYFHVNANVPWRLTFAAGAVFSVALFLVASFAMPESHIWLQKGTLSKDDDEAEVVSSSVDPLLGKSSLNADVGVTGVETVAAGPTDPLLGMEGAGAPATHPRIANGWAGLFSRPALRPLLIGLLLGAVMAWTGINAVFFYAPNIFEDVGLGDQKEVMTIVLGAWNVLATVLATFLVDRLGRKPLLLGGLSVMTVTLFTLASSVTWITGSVGHALSVICLFGYVFGFAVGPGATFWVVLNENFPVAIRDQGAALINLQQWTENLLLTGVFPIVVSAVTIKPPLWFFGSLSLLALLLLAVLLKETGHKSKVAPAS